MSEQDQNNLVNTVGYDEPIGWPEVVQEAFLHGATLSSEDLERRRRRRSHHTVPVYLLRLFSEREERLHAFDRETQLAFETGPRRLLCEKGANTVVSQAGKLRADVEGVFAYIDSLLSKTVKRIVKAMRRMRNQLIHERRDPGRIDLQLVEAQQWEWDAVALWCSQRKRNPHNADFRHLDWTKWIGALETMTPPALKMLFDVWRVTPDRGAIAELMGGARTDHRGCAQARVCRRRRAREPRPGHR